MKHSIEKAGEGTQRGQGAMPYGAIGGLFPFSFPPPHPLPPETSFAARLLNFCLRGQGFEYRRLGADGGNLVGAFTDLLGFWRSFVFYLCRVSTFSAFGLYDLRYKCSDTEDTYDKAYHPCTLAVYVYVFRVIWVVVYRYGLTVAVSRGIVFAI